MLKKVNLLCIVILFFASCGLKDQAEQLKALEDCSYEIVSADSVYLAGTDVTSLLNRQGLDLFQAPQIAFAYFQKSMPLKGVLNVKISNNGSVEAGITQFEYIVNLKDTELISGVYNDKITVPAKGSAIVPIRIDKDIYSLISSKSNRQAVANFFTSETEQTVPVTFKIKPGFLVGSEIMQYPNYIDIQKTLSSTTVKEYLKKAR